MSLLPTIACVVVVSLGCTNAYAQAAEGTIVVVDRGTSGSVVRSMNLCVDFVASMRLDHYLQPSTRTRSGARARSKKRIVAAAIVGSVGGFFGGGFLGAHIEGDRCNCDDPGVRGFLIGAPIGAAAGGILGAKFLF